MCNQATATRPLPLQWKPRPKLLPHRVWERCHLCSQSRLNLAALLLFPPTPTAGASAALGAVLLLTGLWVKYAPTTWALFEVGSLTHNTQ